MGKIFAKYRAPTRKVSLNLQVFLQKMQLMATLLLTMAIVGLAVLLLGVKVFFIKGGRFPNTHIHDNAEMRKRGITCARDKEFYK